MGTANNNNDSPEYRPDGNDETQITTDDFFNWFPHVSPNGMHVAYMSYDKGVTGHPNDADIHGRSGVVPFGGVESGQPESGVGELPGCAVISGFDADCGHKSAIRAGDFGHDTQSGVFRQQPAERFRRKEIAEVEQDSLAPS